MSRPKKLEPQKPYVAYDILNDELILLAVAGQFYATSHGTNKHVDFGFKDSKSYENYLIIGEL